MAGDGRTGGEAPVIAADLEQRDAMRQIHARNERRLGHDDDGRLDPHVLQSHPEIPVDVSYAVRIKIPDGDFHAAPSAWIVKSDERKIGLRHGQGIMPKPLSREASRYSSP